MKFSSQLAILCLATGAYSRAVVEERDLQTVTGVLTQVQTGIDSLDSVVNAFNGDPAPLQSKSGQLVSIINAGITTVQASTLLTASETVALYNPVNELKAHAQALSDDLKGQRPAIQTARLCDVTRQQISDINSASQALITAIVDRVPPAGKSLAQMLADGITQVLNGAQANFAPGQCTNAA